MEKQRKKRKFRISSFALEKDSSQPEVLIEILDEETYENYAWHDAQRLESLSDPEGIQLFVDTTIKEQIHSEYKKKLQSLQKKKDFSLSDQVQAIVDAYSTVTSRIIEIHENLDAHITLLEEWGIPLSFFMINANLNKDKAAKLASTISDKIVPAGKRIITELARELFDQISKKELTSVSEEEAGNILQIFNLSLSKREGLTLAKKSAKESLKDHSFIEELRNVLCDKTSWPKDDTNNFSIEKILSAYTELVTPVLTPDKPVTEEELHAVASDPVTTELVLRLEKVLEVAKITETPILVYKVRAAVTKEVMRRRAAKKSKQAEFLSESLLIIGKSLNVELTPAMQGTLLPPIIEFYTLLSEKITNKLQKKYEEIRSVLAQIEDGEDLLHSSAFVTKETNEHYAELAEIIQAE